LFNQKIIAPKFTAKARKTLIELGDLNWSEINPDIFGSMIQAVVVPEYRSDLGMHYTSVINILKLIKPLFLDGLYEEFEDATTINQLRVLAKRISKIKFFDPACGSGNFLIITYKEIRLLEILILERITDLEGNAPTIKWTDIQLSQFYGIEIDDFAHEMAILSLWLAEHQMNKVFEERLFDFGKSKPILPLKDAGQITQGNATRVDWNAVCPISKKDEVYVIGNPPYLGSRNQDKDQKDDMKFVFLKDYKSLDYIAAWFYKGADYIKGFNAKSAFVSTNSICQGEQVGLTWGRILSDNIEFDFAHQSFKWTNNAKGNAGVTVIILGLRNTSNHFKYLFKDRFKQEVKNINPYLVDASNIVVTGRNVPISKFPIMTYGNMPLEGGFLRFKDEEKKSISNINGIQKYIRKVIGGEEFLKGINRYCFWIEDNELEDALKYTEIKERIEKVELFRINGGDVARTLVSRSHQFRYRHSPKNEQIVIPCTSSENRDYIPCGIYDNSYISLNSIQTINDAEPYVFGITSSRMHMVWVRAVGGKLEERFRYSAKLCYNTFPFPDITNKQKENLNLYVFAILDERAKHNKTMAQMYNPTTMPKGLLLAHQELDTAIEQCYRLQPFKNDTERLEYLFKQYEEMLQKDTLFAKQKKIRKKTVK
jgi:type II restriction/modification system DNA methylase subunit YeeA